MPLAWAGAGAISAYLGVCKGTDICIFSGMPVCRHPCLLVSARMCLCVYMTESVTAGTPVSVDIDMLFLSINGYFAICRDVCAYL